jgi:hypothetical protein
VAASVTSSTHERKSKTNIVMSKAKMYLKHNAFVCAPAPLPAAAAAPGGWGGAWAAAARRQGGHRLLLLLRRRLAPALLGCQEPRRRCWSWLLARLRAHKSGSGSWGACSPWARWVSCPAHTSPPAAPGPTCAVTT